MSGEVAEEGAREWSDSQDLRKYGGVGQGCWQPACHSGDGNLIYSKDTDRRVCSLSQNWGVSVNSFNTYKYKHHQHT